MICLCKFGFSFGKTILFFKGLNFCAIPNSNKGKLFVLKVLISGVFNLTAQWAQSVVAEPVLQINIAPSEGAADENWKSFAPRIRIRKPITVPDSIPANLNFIHYIHTIFNYLCCLAAGAAM